MRACFGRCASGVGDARAALINSAVARDVRAGGWIFGLLLFAGLCFAVVRFTEVEQWVALARDARPGWLFVALVMQAATYLCVAVVWRSTLVATRTTVPMRTLIGLSIAKLYSDQVLPSGGVSGGAFVVSALRARGVDRSIALTVLLVMTLGYYAAYLVATAASLLLLWLYHRLEAWMLLVALVFSVVAVVIPAALLWARGRARIERLQRVLPKRFSELLAGILRGIHRRRRTATIVAPEYDAAGHDICARRRHVVGRTACSRPRWQLLGCAAEPGAGIDRDDARPCAARTRYVRSDGGRHTCRARHAAAGGARRDAAVARLHGVAADAAGTVSRASGLRR